MYLAQERFKEINYVSISFENGELMTVHMDDIQMLCIGDITEKMISINGDDKYQVTFVESKGIYLKINGECKTRFTALERDKSIHQRIREGSDITVIDLSQNIQESYEDGIRVNWKGEDYNNELQMSGFDSEGNFHVYIGDEEKMLKEFYHNVGING